MSFPPRPPGRFEPKYSQPSFAGRGNHSGPVEFTGAGRRTGTPHFPDASRSTFQMSRSLRFMPSVEREEMNQSGGRRR